ncbi:Tannase/feruloyl esterase [Aspergillus ambiguus]|uniref:Tannase/feruloyl esterase n=1 Tax=Aspergillus ambiguus TaxID=176160 RepID=UPI003CCE39E0
MDIEHSRASLLEDYVSSVCSQTLDFCNVSLTLLHPGGNDSAYIALWLPLSSWNGRYMATGGGGLAAGLGEPALHEPVAQGYAVSTTDGGLSLKHTVDPGDGIWALKPDGSLNEPLIFKLAWRSVHDMAVVSRSIIAQFYGQHPTYSYFTGCSQGGRQGYAAAAKYPEDFDGIMANAPAVSGVYYTPAAMWPPVVMYNDHVVPPYCVLEAYQKAITAQCDPLDAATDGLISDYNLLENCFFDTMALVGMAVPCPVSSSNVTITTSRTAVVSKILDGPRGPDGKRLWYGVPPGASFGFLARTVYTGSTWIPQPFSVAEGNIKYMILRNASYDLSEMTYDDWLMRAGGKLLTWVGAADDTIPPSGVLRYRDKVEQTLGGFKAVDDFYRLFFAPGVGHCHGGSGPQVVDDFGALVDWVENKRPPNVLFARRVNPDGTETTRNWCRYPKQMVYVGGVVNLADSFACR